MIYQTFNPCQELSSLVKCFWTLESVSGQNLQRQTIIPDGCMEMVFHHGDLYQQYTRTGHIIFQPQCFVMGQLTRPLEVEPTGITGIFSVRFHPQGFLPFTTFPIKNMENKAVSIERIFGKEGKKIGKEILNTVTTFEKINLIENFLLNRLEERETIDDLVKSAVDLILNVQGKFSIEDLSMHLNVNRRKLERKFSSDIGLSPKQLSKIIRLQATLKILRNGKPKSFSALAYDGEYYDQAHFIKDFKELTGFTPKNISSSNLKMSTLLNSKD